jgi:hypothetical protein
MTVKEYARWTQAASLGFVASGLGGQDQHADRGLAIGRPVTRWQIRYTGRNALSARLHATAIG